MTCNFRCLTSGHLSITRTDSINFTLEIRRWCQSRTIPVKVHEFQTSEKSQLTSLQKFNYLTTSTCWKCSYHSSFTSNYATAEKKQKIHEQDGNKGVRRIKYGEGQQWGGRKQTCNVRQISKKGTAIHKTFRLLIFMWWFNSLHWCW